MREERPDGIRRRLVDTAWRRGGREGLADHMTGDGCVTAHWRQYLTLTIPAHHSTSK